MQPEHFPNTNTFTCQGLMPKVREKFKTSSNFFKNAFLSCGLLLTSIIKKNCRFRYTKFVSWLQTI